MLETQNMQLGFMFLPHQDALVTESGGFNAEDSESGATADR